MVRSYRQIDFNQLVDKSHLNFHNIFDDIVFLDEYKLNPVKEYEFVAPWNHIIEVLSGSGYVYVNSIKFPVNGHCMIGYLRGQKIRIHIGGRTAVQRSIIFSDVFLEDLYNVSVKLSDFKAAVIQYPVIPLDNQIGEGMNIYFSALRHLSTMPQNHNVQAGAKYLTLSFFFGALYGTVSKLIGTKSTRKSKLSNDFINLLEKNFKEEHCIDFYADALNVSKCYLHECLVETTGKTPGYWVDYYLTSAAKDMLSDRNISIQQIAQILNYSGLSQFGKFFKKHTGMSPSQYRMSMM